MFDVVEKTPNFQFIPVAVSNPSLSETLGCGNIFIAHKNIFNHGVSAGMFFYFRSAEGIPRFIENVEKLSGAARENWGSKVRVHIHKKYDWDKIANRYMQLAMEEGKH